MEKLLAYSNLVEEEYVNPDVQSVSDFLEEADDFIEHYGGCCWSDGLPEIIYPSWLDSFKETISDNILLQDIYLPDVPVTPVIEVMTSNIVMGDDEGKEGA